MKSLRSRVIRLAHTRPDLRAQLLPLLKRAATGPDAVYEKALENLEDLAALSENAQGIIDEFNSHYASERVADMDPTIVSESAILRKVVEGEKLATQTVQSMENLVKLFPEEKKYQKAFDDAKKMVEKFSKQIAASKKIIRTISKKIAPKEITALGKKIESKIEARLIDPSQIETYFVQGMDYNKNVEFYFVVRASVPSTNSESPRPREMRLWLVENLSAPGVRMVVNHDTSPPSSYGLKPATVDGAVQEYMNLLTGWKNVKGESEGQAARSGTAKSVASAVNMATRRLGHDSREAEISSDFRSVEGGYRSSNLPKEGAYSVGESEYDELVARETATFRKALDSALSSYKDQISKISISDGEKSWMYVHVTLK